MKWTYERGDQDGRKKHRWNRDEAGFFPGGKGPIGKCPKHITQEIAQSALDEGVPFAISADEDEDEEKMPDKIYMVYQGVIYEAAVTVPGHSFHAYPWRGDLPGRLRLPNSILRKLEAKLKNEGEKQIFRKWLKKYGG